MSTEILKKNPRRSNKQRLIKKILGVIGIAVALYGCNAVNRSLAPDDMVAVSIGAVGHYGSTIGIPEFTVNGHWGGNNTGWGGGGGGMCCVLLPATIAKPVMVTVKWETYRSNVEEARMHEQTVPVHFAIQPGKGGAGLFVHFLPGHRAEVWYAEVGPSGRAYPGPAYPHGPAPKYTPLDDEQRQPLSSNGKDKK